MTRCIFLQLWLSWVRTRVYESSGWDVQTPMSSTYTQRNLSLPSNKSMELSYRVNTAGIQRKVDFYGMDKVSKFLQSFIDTNVFDYTLNLDFFDLEYQNLFLQNLWEEKKSKLFVFWISFKTSGDEDSRCPKLWPWEG